MNVNALLVFIGMKRIVFLVLEDKFSIRTEIYVNAHQALDGMDLDVPLLKFAKTVNNGMCLSLCVSAQIIVFGMELIV